MLIWLIVYTIITKFAQWNMYRLNIHVRINGEYIICLDTMTVGHNSSKKSGDTISLMENVLFSELCFESVHHTRQTHEYCSIQAENEVWSNLEIFTIKTPLVSCYHAGRQISWKLLRTFPWLWVKTFVVFSRCTWISYCDW